VKVLIVDDDATTRSVLRRLMVTEFGCTVSEVEDGLDALHLLGKQPFSLMLLDLHLPVFDGLQTLQVIRSSPDLSGLPVVVLSVDREEATVRKLVHLGVSDYLIKPFKVTHVAERLRRVVGSLGTTPTAMGPSNGAGANSVPVPDGTTIVIADGDADFRHMFVNALSSKRPVLQAESGAQALKTCVDSNPGAVFVGGNLGLLGAELLLPKLRALPTMRNVRIIAIADKKAQDAGGFSAYDGVVVRTYLPDALVRQVDNLFRLPGGEPLARLLTLLPTLRSSMMTATEQVFGMMMSTAVSQDSEGPAAGRAVVASSALAWEDGDGRVDFSFRCDLESAAKIAAALTGAAPEPGRDEELCEAAAEILNMIIGRITNALSTNGVNARFALPASRITDDEPARSDTSAPAIALDFCADEHHVRFRLSVTA